MEDAAATVRSRVAAKGAIAYGRRRVAIVDAAADVGRIAADGAINNFHRCVAV